MVEHNSNSLRRPLLACPPAIRRRTSISRRSEVRRWHVPQAGGKFQGKESFFGRDRADGFLDRQNPNHEFVPVFLANGIFVSKRERRALEDTA